MKKQILAMAFIVLLASCGDSGEKKDESKTAETTETKPVADPSSNPDYQKGLDLISKSDCLTCHKPTEKLIGPAYQDVANKYENTQANITMLAEKIIKGGTGVWGQVAMLPHPQISQADAEQMVKYVLLLKSN